MDRGGEAPVLDKVGVKSNEKIINGDRELGNWTLPYSAENGDMNIKQ